MESAPCLPGTPRRPRASVGGYIEEKGGEVEDAPVPAALDSREEAAERVKVVCRIRPVCVRALRARARESARESGRGPRPRPQLSSSEGGARGGGCALGVDSPVSLHLEDPTTGQRSQWNFDAVYDASASQADVYREVDPLVNGLLEGFNGSVLAYGQTSSGKTFTMQGQISDAANCGVLPRVCESLFRRVRGARAP